MKEWQKKLDEINWRLKNEGFEITNITGARCGSGNPSKGLKYIEEHFDDVVKFLKERSKPDGIRMRITYCCVFDLKKYTEEETMQRNMLNEMGLGEAKPEHKTRAADVRIGGKENAEYVSFVGKIFDGTNRAFEVRVTKDDATKIRNGIFNYNKETKKTEYDWEDWQTTADYDYKYADLYNGEWYWRNKDVERLHKSIERKMKKYLHEAC